MSSFAELARAVRPQAFQVLDAHDLEWIRIQRAMTMSGGLTHFWQRYSEPRIKRYALERFSCVDCVTFLSQADADLARRDLPNPARLEVVPMGLMLAEYPAPNVPPQPERVLFFGSFRHQPNVDALRFLLQDIWPHIRQACPQATLDLMGSSMPTWVQQANRQVSGVRVLGFQPDIRPTVAEASVVIAPLRFGSGVKIKILEAMALGKAVVTTSIGAEGIEAQPDRDLVIADGAQSLASAAIRLLTEPTLRNSVGQHARQFIQTHHAADEISKGFLSSAR